MENERLYEAQVIVFLKQKPNPFCLFVCFCTGVKNYSNWPTIPQVYLNGEFVGGCDILLQMHQNGDLVEELKKLGIRSALLDAEKDQDKK